MINHDHDNNLIKMEKIQNNDFYTRIFQLPTYSYVHMHNYIICYNYIAHI